MKQSNIMQRVEGYLDLYGGISDKVEDGRVAMAILQEISKDRRMEEIKAERETRNGEAAATPRQLAFLEKLGVDVPENVSKKLASELIDEALGKE
jgi:hypothetical protein